MTMHQEEPAGGESLVDLIEMVLGGRASGGQKRKLQARLLASAEDRRAYLHRQVSVCQ